MTFEILYLSLILIGATILTVVALLLRQARSQAARTLELTSLNERLNFDLPDLLHNSWSVLEAGGFLGLHWVLDWFGTRIEATQGIKTAQVLDQSFEAQGIQLKVYLYMPKNRWERRYFSQTLAQSFFLQLRMNMWIKLGSVNATFEQSARMTVFLQHDIKNMLQLLNLVADQLQMQTPDKAKTLLPVLERSIPALRDRANLILARVVSGADRHEAKSIDLQLFISEAISVHELEAEVIGAGRVEIAEDALHSIIDNLLGNYRQIAQTTGSSPKLLVSIEQNNHSIRCSIKDSLGKPFTRPERLFEPFWSANSRGRGVGLYQAREVSRSWGGKLEVLADVRLPLEFLLELPIQKGPSGSI